MRLDKLTPDNCFVTFISKTVEKEENIKLEKEYYYGTPFAVQKLSSDALLKLNSILPEEGINLGNCPPNPYIPQNLIEKKAELKEDGKPAFPVQIEQNPVIWFKQDDSFDQPLIYCSAKI